MCTKRTTSRFISFLLLIAMLLSNTTGMSFAIDTSHIPTPNDGLITATYINPEYAHLNIELPTPKPGVSTLSDAPAFDSFEEAGAYLCDQMELRKDTISFSINGYNISTSEELSADTDKLFSIACAHTGDPTGGDYLERHLGGSQVSWNGVFTFTVSYHTTAAQETEMDTAVADLLADWDSEYDIYDLSDYEKICIVYDYICANVTYDYINLHKEDYKLKYSAYAALINGTAVCQGYASLFYRLALELGVDARYISGIGNGGPHGWNIVDMGDYYYYLDATWDAEQDFYNWFLCGSENFPDHTPNEDYLTEEFTAQYPIDTENFDAPSETIVYSGTCGKDNAITWTLSRSGVLTITGSGEIPKYSPASIAPWSEYCNGIKNLIIGEGITKIGAFAFYWSPNMTQVTIPVSVTEIGGLAFTDCAALKTVYYAGSEEDWAAINIVTVDSMYPTVPSNSDLLNAEIIYNYTSGETPEDPDEPETPEIPEDTVASGTCGENLVWYVTEDNTLTVSGTGEMDNFEDSFETPWYDYLEQITSLVIADGVASIGAHAFSYSINVTSFEIPESVTSIGEEAFFGCYGLVSITIPASVTSLSNNVFACCSGLETVTICEGLSTIKAETFVNCTSLTTVNLPVSVKNIEHGAFFLCSELSTVNYAGTEEQWEAIETDYDNHSLLNAKINFNSNGETPEPPELPEIPEDAIAGGTHTETIVWYLTEDGTLTVAGTGKMNDEIFGQDLPWYDYRSQITKVVVADGVTHVSTGAFQELESLTTVVLADSVTSIGLSAFNRCSNLISINIPSNVTEIGAHAFLDCTNLPSIVIPEGVTCISMGLFEECTNLVSVDLPDSVTTIERTAFWGCEKLTAIEIPSGVTSIGDRVFIRCESLTSIEIPSGVTVISECLFSGCSNLRSVVIPEGVTKICMQAFLSCFALESIKIPSSVTTIESGAFSNCSSLTSIEIPAGVTSIDRNIFDRAYGLTEIIVDENNPNYCSVDGVLFDKDQKTLISYPIGKTAAAYTVPGTVTSIGEDAFAYNEHLTHITLLDGVTTINPRAFCFCEALTYVRIPASVTYIEMSAFLCSTDNLTVYYGGTEEQWNKLITECKVDDLYDVPVVYNAGSETPGETPDDPDEPELPEGAIAAGTHGENLEWVLDKDGVLTISGEGAMDESDPSWLEHSEDIVKVVVENGVTSISSLAFNFCSNITQVALPATITEIAYGAFSCCTALAYINLPEGLTSIGIEAFFDCDSLTSIVIPSSVTFLGNLAFALCDSLEQVTILEGVDEIKREVFANCTALIAIDIPLSVEYILDSAFTGCAALAIVNYAGTEAQWNAITIEDNNESLLNAEINFEGTDAPDESEVIASGECGAQGDNLTWTLTTDGTLTISGEGEMDNWIHESRTPWYEHFNQITAVVIENGATNIGDYAFYGCSTLASVTIPDSVTSIGEGVFQYCESLKSVTIANGVTSIGEHAFYGCLHLASVTIGDNVTSIGQYAFGNCEHLTSVTIPNSVTSIGKGAFSWCTSLTDATIGNSVTSIGDYVFSSCKSLTSVTIPDSVTSIGKEAFASCYSLTSVTIPDSVTSIGESSFEFCASLTSVTIGDSVTSIGEYAFHFCESLANIIVDPSNLNYCSIDGVLFNKNATVLIQYSTGNPRTVYTIPDSVTSIGEYAFKNCEILTSITIPDSVTSIGWGAFQYCASLTSVTIGDSVTSISSNAFYSCESLTSITIPASVTSIGDLAFTDCNALETVYYGGTSQQWNDITIGEYNDPLLNAKIIFEGEDIHTHTWGDVTYIWSEDNAHCTAESNCTDCGETVTETVTATVETIDPTCTAAGCTVYTATFTNELFASQQKKEEIPALDHDYDDGVVTIAPTCTTSGIMTYTCQRCGNSYTEEIPATGHAEEIIPGKEPTCTESGLTEGKKCVNCSEIIVAQEEIPAKGHTDEDGDYICDVCGEVLDKPDEPELPEGIIAMGTCGANLTWTLSKDGVLTISGEGEMFSFTLVISPLSAIPMSESAESAPWSEYTSLITKIVVEDGVTSIGDNAFAACENLTEIEIPATVTSIGDNAFSGCEALETVTYTGSEEQWNEIEIGAGNETFEESDVVIADILLGDVNGDGKVNGTDTNLIFRHVSGTTELTGDQLKAADVNGDGKINGTDTNLVFRFVSGTLDTLG